MLAITVLTVLTLFVISLVDAKAFGAEVPASQALGAVPDTLALLSERITIGSDGNAGVEVVAVLGKGGSGDLLLPFAFEAGQDFAILSGPVVFSRDAAGAPRPVREVLGHRMLNLATTSLSAAGDTVVVSASVPGWFNQKEAREEYGEFSLGHQYLNTSRFLIKKFTLELELPPGMLVHTVTKVVPGYDPKKSPEPPYQIGRSENAGWATLHQENLAPAGGCRLDMHIRPARRGPVPLIAGVVLALLYLVFFRDVLKAKETE
nr:hypothetical protein [Candidatus Krumholzibacteria bacterium]